MYNKILVPLDGSKLAECVLDHAKVIVGEPNEITLLYVIEPLEVPLSSEKYKRNIEADAGKAAKDYLKRTAAKLKRGGGAPKTEVVFGKPAKTIVSYAADSGANLIVMATHGRSGVQRWFLGSVADAVLHSASVPVLLVRAPGCSL